MRSSTSIEEIEIFYLLKEATQKTVELPKNKYELSNHLGNVLVTTSDLRKGADNNADGIADYYNAIVTTANDYFAFGSLMGGRQYNSTGYVYSFNTQLKSDEISGNGNHTTALFWEYDTRLGRRWNLDPIPQISISDYAVNGNNPLNNIDILGDKVKYSENLSKQEKKEYKSIVKDLRKHSPTFNKIYKEVKRDKEIYTLDKTEIKEGDKYESEDKTLYLNLNGNSTAPTNITLAHEFGHLYRDMLGLDVQSSGNESPEGKIFDAKASIKREFEGLHIENIIRAELGVNLREEYGRIKDFSTKDIKTLAGHTILSILNNKFIQVKKDKNYNYNIKNPKYHIEQIKLRKHSPNEININEYEMQEIYE